MRPDAVFSAGEVSRHLRAGLAMEIPVTLGLDFDRREGATRPADHGITLRIGIRL